MSYLGGIKRSLDPRAEDGIALVLALAVLVFFSITTVTAMTMANSTQSSASTGSSQQSAYALAEAGINTALAVLNGQLDSTGAVASGGVSPLTTTLLPSTTVQYSSLGGSVTYSGTLNTTTYVWTITSTGHVTSGSTVATKTLTRTVTVAGINNGATDASWSRFYQDSTSSCLTIDAQAFVTNVGTRGDLCLRDGGTITGADKNVDVGGSVTITGPDTSSGAHSPSAGTGWTTPTNVYTSNSIYATNLISAGATGANQNTTGFGFALPATARIDGISVSVQRLASACCNAVQTITVTGSPTGGTFKLTGTPPGGSATATSAIARNAPATGAGSVQTALQAVYGSSNVTCTGGPLPTGVVCTFQGSYASMPVSLMTMSTNSLTGGSSPKAVITNTTTGSVGALQDNTVQLLKAGSPVGSNKASATTWGTTSSTVGYGSSSDLWGTTWTAADVNASNFGLRFAAKNVAAASATASLDYVSVTVTYTSDVNGIGTSSTPVNQLNVGGTCTYNAGGAHAPCGSADHTYATTSTTTSLANNPILAMPSVDFNYWWANAKPGPKHFCTNPNPGLATNFFDNDAATTTGPNKSLTVNGEMAPATSDYTCQVWSIPPTGGTLLGELSWNHVTHVMHVSGTIFVDGNFRWDTDGAIVHYFGRATIMSSEDDEIDAVVCAGGSGTTAATSCLNDMSNWDSSQNEIVLMSQQNNEYDQGSSTCAGNTPPTCYNGHLPAGFQGILYSTADCLIHQNFQDSGPVICNTISLPNESGINPTYYTFPSVGNLTDGMKYAGTATASHFELDNGTQTG